jgi:hypothetical protein
MEGRAVRHNFERDPPRDNPCQVWFNLVQWFQRRRFKCGLPAKMAAKLKIEKRGDEILIVHCCFSVSQNEAEILTAATWQEVILHIFWVFL